MEQRNLVLFIASTLDGYIATKDHNLNWLFNVEGEGDNGMAIEQNRSARTWVDNRSDFVQFELTGRICIKF